MQELAYAAFIKQMEGVSSVRAFEQEDVKGFKIYWFLGNVVICA